MLVALFMPSVALGATFTVGPSGDYATIGAAVSVSTDGDSIEVAPGIYPEQVVLGLKDVEVISTDGPAVTSIVGDGSGAVVSISDESTEATHISGFTLVADVQRCIQINGGSPRLSSLVMEDCGSDALERGGAVFIREANVTMTDLTVTGATARYGGGLACTDGAVVVSSSVFEDNFAFSADGGAMNLIRCDATLSDVTFDGNRAAFSGGGIAGQNSPLAVTDSRFNANQAVYGDGGAVAWQGADALSIADTQATLNTARQSGGGFHFNNIDAATLERLNLEGNRAEAADSAGGAISVRSSTIDLDTVAFQANESGGFGGALFAQLSTARATRMEAEFNETSGIGGALYADLSSIDVVDSLLNQNTGTSGGGGMGLYASSLLVERTQLVDNTARGGQGGGVWLVNSSMETDRMHLLGNDSMVGGGLFGNGVGTVRIQSSVLQENVADFDGGGLFLTGPIVGTIQSSDFIGNETLVTGTIAQAALEIGSTDFRNNIVAFGRNGVGVGLDSAGSITVRHNNLWGNDSGAYSGSDDRTGIDGNIAVDPDYVDLSIDNDFTNDDLHLNRSSPCLGSGDPETATETVPEPDIGAFGVTEIPDIDIDGDGFPPDLGGDCNDADPTVHPGADELCGDDVDNNCDGSVDEGCATDTGGGEEDTGQGIDSGSTDSGVISAREDDTGGVPAGVKDLYAIDGSGCRCSTKTTSPSGWLTLAFPLLLAAGRRRQ